MHTRSLNLLSAFSLAFSFAACGPPGSCPEGTVEMGGRCQTVGPDAGASRDGGGSDASSASPEDAAAPVVGRDAASPVADEDARSSTMQRSRPTPARSAPCTATPTGMAAATPRCP
ncbi:MAG: hypothetical protein OHK0013_37530 [Sandaracinaceae bacterium]